MEAFEFDLLETGSLEEIVGPHVLAQPENDPLYQSAESSSPLQVLLTDSDEKIFPSITVPSQEKQPMENTVSTDSCSKANAGTKRAARSSSNSQKSHRCPFCNAVLSSSYALKVHQRKHSGETPYICGLCTKGFTTSSDLKRHSRIHTGDRPYGCTEPGCGRSFTTAGILAEHLKGHRGEKPYRCEVADCGKTFGNVTNLRNHCRIHSGERPFRCRVADCDKSFTEYSSLYKHLVVHTAEKPYKCTNCGNIYRQSSSLRQHMRCHSIKPENIDIVVRCEPQVQRDASSRGPCLP